MNGVLPRATLAATELLGGALPVWVAQEQSQNHAARAPERAVQLFDKWPILDNLL
ncbi:MAG: hypothetical protein M3Z14_01050 [Candidatus Eremiobacteraeota bacterium]|nr:hypothetical protein [Candidatus Eremiobacteraeota bacterium]